MLQYVLDGKASDELTCELDAVVAGINSDSRRWQKVDGFMSQEMNWANRVYAARQEGLAEGEAKGEARMAELFDRLAAADRVPDYAKATKDAAYRDSLMREFGLA